MAEVVFVMTTAAADGGGIAAVNRLMVPALVAVGDDLGTTLHVVSLMGGDAERALVPDRHRYESCGGSRARFGSRLVRHALRRRFFIFERVGLARPVLPFAASGLVETVIFAHGSENWRDVALLHAWCLKSSTLVLTNSEYTQRRMRQSLPSVHTVACPLGLSSSFALTAAPPDPASGPVTLESADGVPRELGERALLLVGRLHPDERQKGHHALVDVLPSLLARHPDVQLVFPGPGDDRPALLAYVRRAGLADRVFVPGFVSDETLDLLYRKCFAFTMPSRQEGFGLVYLEAMNYAKPCVGCFEDGAEDVIVDGATGYLVHDPNDPAELSATLLKLLDDPVRARELGRNGWRRLRTHFTPARFQERFRAHVRALLTPVEPSKADPTRAAAGDGR